MSDQPVVVPRPDPSSEVGGFVERVRALRGDARVGVAVLACVAVASGVASFRAGIAPAAPAAPAASGPVDQAGSARETTSSVVVATTTTTGLIVIDVVGAVRAPGVVRLPATARVFDAIRAAGGATPAADLTQLNLAAKVGDGTRVAVPVFGQPPPAVDPTAVSGAGDLGGTDADGSSGIPNAPVNVNSASAAELEALPGIGPTLAAAIVQERDQNGPFRSIDDLTRVHGIGPGRLDQLRDFVAL